MMTQGTAPDWIEAEKSLAKSLQGDNDELFDWTTCELPLRTLKISMKTENDELGAINSEKKHDKIVLDHLRQMKPQHRIAMDLAMRHFNWSPPPQVLMHLPSCSKDGDYAQRRCFNLPAYFYNCCSDEQSLVNVGYGFVEEFALGLDYVNTTPRIALYNSHLELFDQKNRRIRLEPGFGRNPNFKRKKGEEFSDENYYTTSTVHGHHLILEDGQLFDETSSKVLDLIVNNSEIMAHEKVIKDVAFHKNKEGSVEVFILFNQLFMASGTIRQRSNSEEIFCDVREIPGSYGTTSFVCSPNFKAMLRVCHIQTENPEKAENVNERIIISQERISAVLEEVEEMHEDGKLESKINHTGEGGTYLDEVCRQVQATIQVVERFYQNNSMEKYKFLTSREKLHLCYYQAHKIENWSWKNSCHKGRCKQFKKFLEICQTFLHNAEVLPMDKDVLADFGEQLVCALYAIKCFFIIEGKINRDVQNILNCALMFSNIYDYGIKQAFRNFHNWPEVIMQELAIDIYCQNELPSSFEYILALYGFQGRNPEHSSKRMILNAIKKYPYVMLFSHAPSAPRKGLIKSFGEFLDTRCNHVKDPTDDDNELCGTIHLLEAIRESGSPDPIEQDLANTMNGTEDEARMVEEGTIEDPSSIAISSSSSEQSIEPHIDQEPSTPYSKKKTPSPETPMNIQTPRTETQASQSSPASGKPTPNSGYRRQLSGARGEELYARFRITDGIGQSGKKRKRNMIDSLMDDISDYDDDEEESAIPTPKRMKLSIETNDSPSAHIRPRLGMAFKKKHEKSLF